MKQIQDSAAFFFIFAVGVLAAIAALGVWEILNGDVISKSYQTLGLLAFVAVVVMIAGRFLDKSNTDGQALELPNPIFHAIRRLTLGVLIISASLLALLGVLAIWEVIADKEVLYRSLGTLAIFAFSALIIVMTCVERERIGTPEGKKKSLSIGSIIALLFVASILFSFFSSIARW